MFLSCTSFVVNTTFSTGLVGVEVTSFSWLAQAGLIGIVQNSNEVQVDSKGGNCFSWFEMYIKVSMGYYKFKHIFMVQYRDRTVRGNRTARRTENGHEAPKIKIYYIPCP